MKGFWVLLGPDFAGKSTALARLADEHGWQVISHDDRFVQDHPLVAKLRNCWVDDALARAGERYTAELVLSVMHSIILYQRDELRRRAGTAPVIMDSYFYKPMAASSLIDRISRSCTCPGGASKPR